MYGQRVLSSLALILLLAAGTPARQIWVDDDNTTPPYRGTLQHPFPHPGWADRFLRPGDTLNVLDGVYRCDPADPNTYLRITMQGSPASPWTLIRAYRANPDDRAVLVMPDGVCGNCIYVAYSTWNLIIEGFDVGNAHFPGTASVHPSGIWSEGNRVHIRDNHFFDCAIGVYLRTPDTTTVPTGIEIYRNVFRHCGEAGIRVKGNTNIRIASNLFHSMRGWYESGWGAITLYRLSGAEVCNNTIIVLDSMRAIRLYNGSGVESNPCIECRIFDNVSVSLDTSERAIFAVDFRMAAIASNEYHHNTWWDIDGADHTLFAFGPDSYGGFPLLSLNEYLDALPDNGINGQGEAVRDPLLQNGHHFPCLLTAASPEIDAGSRTVQAAGMSGLTALVSQALDSGPVDRGYHQFPISWLGAPVPEPPGETASSAPELRLPPGSGLVTGARLYDLLGRRVADLQARDPEGAISEAYSLRLPAGMYLLRLDTRDGGVTLRVPVRR